MQVFVPHDTFKESVRVLDQQRLGKQRVETYQILLQLFELAPGKDDKSVWDGTFHPRKPSWRNHPAVLAWQDHPFALYNYQLATCDEWVSRGYKDTCLNKSFALMCHVFPGQESNDAPMPDWWGDDRIHASHRAALLFKAPIWYAQFGWQELPEYNYVWPHLLTKEGT